MTAKGYTTETLVEAEIGKSITTSTTPTTDQVAQWIEESENYIDKRTHTSFTSTTKTDEIYSWNANTAFISPTSSEYYGNIGRQDYGFLKVGNAFKLNNQPILTMTDLSLNQASASSADSWTELTQNTGSGGDYVVDLDTGTVTLLTNIPRYGERSIKASYTYGYSTIPPIVKTLATKMVARRVIDMQVKKSSMTSSDSVSLASLSIKKELGQNMGHLRQLDVEIEDLFKQVGELYTQWV